MMEKEKKARMYKQMTLEAIGKTYAYWKGLTQERRQPALLECPLCELTRILYGEHRLCFKCPVVLISGQECYFDGAYVAYVEDVKKMSNLRFHQEDPKRITGIFPFIDEAGANILDKLLTLWLKVQESE